MTSTPVSLLLKRSGLASDRPSGVVVQNGELAISVGAADPGLYFEDTAGSIRKIGPSSYGATAPNSTPVGLAGNSTGETWTDSSTTDRYFKVWTGSAWEKISAKYADSAGSASTASTATFATSAGSTTVASGAVLASGAILASGAFSVTTITSSLPNPLSVASGVQFLLLTTSGAYPSGLYVRSTTGYYYV